MSNVQSKTAFLAKVRQANLQGRQGQAPAPRLAAADMCHIDRYQGADREALIERLAEMATVRDYRFHRISKAELSATLATIVAAEAAHHVICPRDGEAAEWALDEMLRPCSDNFHFWHHELSRAELLADVAPADLGVSVVRYAIAHVGSIVEWASTDCGKAVSLLPRVHVAIIPASRILPSLSEVAALYDQAHQGADWPSGIVHTAGPSSTGDIECTIVTGAHGPVREHYIVVEDA